MKVIKENKVPNAFPRRITCRRVVDMYGFDYGREYDFCGSELEIDADDVKKHSWSKYPDYSGIDYGVICPICGQFIVVDKDYIPRYVLDSAVETVL